MGAEKCFEFSGSAIQNIDIEIIFATGNRVAPIGSARPINADLSAPGILLHRVRTVPFGPKLPYREARPDAVASERFGSGDPEGALGEYGIGSEPGSDGVRHFFVPVKGGIASGLIMHTCDEPRGVIE